MDMKLTIEKYRLMKKLGILDACPDNIEEVFAKASPTQQFAFAAIAERTAREWIEKQDIRLIYGTGSFGFVARDTFEHYGYTTYDELQVAILMKAR
jgi:hypothetical protein